MDSWRQMGKGPEIRPLWWWEERGYGLCKLYMKGKQEEVWRIFLRPRRGVWGRGFGDNKEPRSMLRM